MFGMALMGGMAMFTPLDFKEKRWFQPLANFGQFVVAGAVAGFLLDANLGHLEDLDTENLVRVAVASSLAALAYATVQSVLIRKAVKTVFGAENLQPWSQMHVLFIGQFAMGLLGGLIGGAYSHRRPRCGAGPHRRRLRHRAHVALRLLPTSGVAHRLDPGIRQDPRGQGHVHHAATPSGSPTSPR